ncbi:MAG: ion transporter [Clostridia bacterium]|nr:ion transporter [Clostridia bacterium]
MRKSIYSILEPSEKGNIISTLYDVFMIIVIVVSIIPLAFKEKPFWFLYVDYVTASIFIADYLLRLLTADYKLNKRFLSFFLYPFTPMAIIDLVSILPTFLSFGQTLKILKMIRLIRALRVFKALKLIRYSKSIKIIVSVLKKQSKPLLSVVFFAVAYILIAALVIFNVEPDTFDNFFFAIYWATVSLTTVGYGDIYPVTDIGRTVTMISSVLGIAIIALPSGIITAGFMLELDKIYQKDDDKGDKDGTTVQKKD